MGCLILLQNLKILFFSFLGITSINPYPQLNVLSISFSEIKHNHFSTNSRYYLFLKMQVYFYILKNLNYLVRLFLRLSIIPPPVICAIALTFMFEFKIFNIVFTYIFVGFRRRFPNVLFPYIFFFKDIFFSRIMFLIRENPFECIPLLGNATKISPALVLPLGKAFFFYYSNPKSC